MSQSSAPVFSDRRQFLRQLSWGSVGILQLLPMSATSLLAADATQLLVHSAAPMNAEPTLADLVREWITPTELFFVRSHGTTPQIDAAAYRLSIEGLVDRPFSMTLAELSELPQLEVTATLTCAGNRRSEHSQIKPVKGVQWREGAIGNARWRGVLLSQLLEKAGIQPGAGHVWFESVDTVEDNGQKFSFGGSIPLEKALLPHETAPPAIVALQMNDQPLTADHGFPVRTVVPGYIGARSVKWLSKIVVSDRPSPNHFVADVYKIVEVGNPLENAEAAPIYRQPLNSAICHPGRDDSISGAKVSVAGYALPPGIPGVHVQKVEVSADQGLHWIEAQWISPQHDFCWRLWSADVSVTLLTQAIWVRATDSRGQSQPEIMPWNAKGYLYNGWHRVPVKVQS